MPRAIIRCLCLVVCAFIGEASAQATGLPVPDIGAMLIQVAPTDTLNVSISLLATGSSAPVNDSWYAEIRAVHEYSSDSHPEDVVGRDASQDLIGFMRNENELVVDADDNAVVEFCSPVAVQVPSGKSIIVRRGTLVVRSRCDGNFKASTKALLTIDFCLF